MRCMGREGGSMLGMRGEGWEIGRGKYLDNNNCGMWDVEGWSGRYWIGVQVMLKARLGNSCE